MKRLTIQNAVETEDSVLEGDVDAGGTSEGLGNLEWLRQETLDLTGTGNDQTLFLGQLTHTQNGNDILECYKKILGFYSANIEAASDISEQKDNCKNIFPLY